MPGERFTRQFRLPDLTVGVMERFLASTPPLARGTVIVHPAQARSLTAPWDEPVLFFHADWRLVYRRIPPSLPMNQLEVGLIAKVIPLGQVLSGKGPLALRTASWEGTCWFKAYDGAFFHLQEWEANDGAILRRGIEEAQATCGEALTLQFNAALVSAGIPAPPRCGEGKFGRPLFPGSEETIFFF